ncbi:MULTISPECIES: cation:proton antiporter [unclassified Oribacterium]|uniref:cation:proton antiporter n=1 Tax=unclassified Oribacterium TaxID=2629782 RepID=UPI00056366D9|nr:MULTISPECIES: cation:proton antiporter [unclassified Oribacterium]SFG20017.1 NhaP-type Na+/H+ or K+/H+ antiporter [Oribacterium sp. WCC10]
MLFSVAMMMLLGLVLSFICKRVKLPGLIGMLITGIVLGPYVLNIIDHSVLSISSDIRKIALIIILTRAGLSLDISRLKKIGRPALMMCFIPASFELIGMLCFAPGLMGISMLEAAIMGAVLAAVSPAVVVPRMVKLIEEGYGVKKQIPQLILAGASVDDVYVIVLFTTFLGIIQGEGISFVRFVNIPVSIVLGILIGLFTGRMLALLFKYFHMRDTVKIMIILSVSFILVHLEDMLHTPITYSALIAIMFIGVGLTKYRAVVSERLQSKYNKLWVIAEVFLFVLVGATVNISYLESVGVKAVLLVAGALLFRMLGVFVCLIGTDLNTKERLFTMMAYTPKATVQAAIGGIPLSAGLSCGDLVLTVAVLAIVITAPLGAFAIDNTYKVFLRKSQNAHME